MGGTRQELKTEFLDNSASLMAFICALVRDPHAAEDIYQEVWIRFSAAVDGGAEVQDTAKWARGIARNLVFHHWRDAKRMEASVDEELASMVGTAFEEQDVNQEFWRARASALTECLGKMPAESQKVLALKYQDNRSIAAIAGETGRSAGAVTQLLFRIRAKLQECAERTLRAQGFTI